MASALDAVLQLKSQEAARQQQQSDNLTQGLQLLMQGKQQAQANQLAQLQYANTLKQQGITNKNTSDELGIKKSELGIKQQETDTNSAVMGAYLKSQGIDINNLLHPQPSTLPNNPIPQGSPIGQLVNPNAIPPMSMANQSQQPNNNVASQNFGVTVPQTEQVQSQNPIDNSQSNNMFGSMQASFNGGKFSLKSCKSKVKNGQTNKYGN